MLNTFIVYSDNGNNCPLRINKFQVNLWEITPHKMVMDIGLQFRTTKDNFFKQKEIKLNFQTPFNIKSKTLKNKYEVLSQTDNIQIIFNEPWNGVVNQSKHSGSDEALLIQFVKDENNLVLIKGNIREENDNKLIIVIDSSVISEAGLKEEFYFYLRFQYIIDIKKCDNIFIKNNSVVDTRYYDFRFNEIRLINKNEVTNIASKKIDIESVYLFLITDIGNKPRMVDESNLRYIRILENGLFKNYVTELNNTKKKYIVHYWKHEKMDDHYNLLIGFEKEKETTKVLFIGIMLHLIGAFLFKFQEWYNISGNRLTNTVIMILAISVLLGGVYFVVKGLAKLVLTGYDFLSRRLIRIL